MVGEIVRAVLVRAEPFEAIEIALAGLWER